MDGYDVVIKSKPMGKGGKKRQIGKRAASIAVREPGIPNCM